jgi:2-oxoisovalerate ferredoxin oxidoreductase delta subunit
MADLINSRGYRFAQYEGDRCTGCGICYYNCPEPGAIAVTKNVSEKVEVPSGDTTG